MKWESGFTDGKINLKSWNRYDSGELPHFRQIFQIETSQMEICLFIQDLYCAFNVMPSGTTLSG